MAFKVIDDVDTGYLDEMLIENGLVRPVRWRKLEHIPQSHLMAWCVRQGVYQIPTWELIEWLRAAINGTTENEICASLCSRVSRFQGSRGRPSPSSGRCRRTSSLAP